MLQLPASSSRVRHNGEHMPAAVLVSVSIWFLVIMLKPATYTSKDNPIYVYDDWWFRINAFGRDKSSFLLRLATQFSMPDDGPGALGPFTARCVNLQRLQRQQCAKFLFKVRVTRYSIVTDCNYESSCWVHYCTSSVRACYILMGLSKENAKIGSIFCRSRIILPYR